MSGNFISYAEAAMHVTPWDRVQTPAGTMLVLRIEMYCAVCREAIPARAAVEDKPQADEQVRGAVEAMLRRRAPELHQCVPRASA